MQLSLPPASAVLRVAMAAAGSSEVVASCWIRLMARAMNSAAGMPLSETSPTAMNSCLPRR